MTPDQLAKSGTEAAHQTALFAWAAVAKTHGFEAAEEWANGGAMPKRQTCRLGVGCEEQGCCYAEAQGDPSQCGMPEAAVPALRWLHHIPNGGTRGDDDQTRKIRGGQLKAQGVRSGVADVFLPWPINSRRGNYAGLYIEMKKPSEKPKKEGSKGGLSDEQIEFGEYAKDVGYGWLVCYSWREAADAIRNYIEWGSK